MEPYDLLKHLVSVLESLGIKYLVTGSIASIFYGEPRFTNDIDVVAKLREEDIQKLLSFFPEEKFYLSENAIRQAIYHHGQFNIIHPDSGLKIDVIIPQEDAFNQSRFQRIKRIQAAENVKADFAAPEDVIIMKMKYYQEGKSEKHLRDITGMLKISGELIDFKYIENWANQLGLLEIWQAIKAKLQKGS